MYNLVRFPAVLVLFLGLSHTHTLSLYIHIYYIILYYIMLYYIILYYNIISYYIILYHIVLYYIIILYHIILYYIINLYNYNCISLGSHPSPQDLVSCLHSWMLLKFLRIAIVLDSSFQRRRLSSSLMQPRGSLARKRCTSAKKYHLLVFLKPKIAIMKLRALRCVRCCMDETQVVDSCENIGMEFAFQ